MTRPYRQDFARAVLAIQRPRRTRLVRDTGDIIPEENKTGNSVPIFFFGFVAGVITMIFVNKPKDA